MSAMWKLLMMDKRFIMAVHASTKTAKDFSTTGCGIQQNNRRKNRKMLMPSIASFWKDEKQNHKQQCQTIKYNYKIIEFIALNHQSFFFVENVGFHKLIDNRCLRTQCLVFKYMSTRNAQHSCSSHSWLARLCMATRDISALSFTTEGKKYNNN